MIGDDITTRLRQTRADMIGTDDEQHYWDCHDAADEIERLHTAIRRIADQDATLSVQGGNVTVTMDCPYVTGTVTRYCTLTPFTLTNAEREAVRDAADAYADNDDDADCERIAATLRGLLDRTK